MMYPELKTRRDWRLPENRLEAFARVVHVRMVEGDLDHHHSGKVIAGEMGLDNEQKVLYSLLFGQSYRNHWAMLAMQLFPELMEESPETLTEWHNQNWFRMCYGNDTKWGVRRWPAFVADLQKKYKGVSLYEHFGNLANTGTRKQNFDAINEELRSLHGIGRMTAWLAQQTLYEFFDWDIDHWDQQLYDSGTWSQYDSLCYLFNRLDISRNPPDGRGGLGKRKITKDDVALMERKTLELMEFLNDRIPFHVDIYNVESAECEYRKTAYGPHKIKEFTFWTTNELVAQYQMLRDKWADYGGPIQPDWRPYVVAFMTKGPNARNFGFSPSYFRVLYDYGLNLNTHFIYPREPDAHQVLRLVPTRDASVARVLREWGEIPEAEREALIKKYDPVKMLKFKQSSHPSWLDSEADHSYAGRVS